jgi:segregation and condensation protein A
MTEPYRVDLDIYNGPLDLLLYLIRRSEVEIIDVPIAAITEQYLAYMEAIQLLEPAVAGDFLVMAATLMEIKSRMLMPKPPPETEEAQDPRSELIQQLLEYKRYKDAAMWLADQAAERAERVGRLAPEPLEAPADAPAPEAPVEVSLWDLVEAFSRLMKATLANVPPAIVDEDVPVQVLSERLLDRLRREHEVAFARLFDGQVSRRQIAAMFLAILELVRLRRIRAMQKEPFGEILISLRGPEVVGEAAEPAAPTAEPSATPPAEELPLDGIEEDTAAETPDDDAGGP